MHSCLENLVSPMSLEVFLKDYWDQKVCHLKGADSHEQIITWDEFATALWQCDFNENDLFFALDAASKEATSNTKRRFYDAQEAWSRLPSVEQVSQACGEATLVFNDMRKRVPRVQSWVLNVYQEIGELIGNNAYFTSAGGRLGLGLHYDPHDIFVLQIHGSKRWRLYHDREDNPVKKVDFSKPRTPPESEVDTIILNAGDVLYMPRGTWHEPLAMEEEASLHCTVSIPRRRYSHFMNWSKHTLASQLGFRESLLTTDNIDERCVLDSVKLLEARDEIVRFLERDGLPDEFFLADFAESFLRLQEGSSDGR